MQQASNKRKRPRSIISISSTEDDDVLAFQQPSAIVEVENIPLVETSNDPLTPQQEQPMVQETVDVDDASSTATAGYTTVEEDTTMHESTTEPVLPTYSLI